MLASNRTSVFAAVTALVLTPLASFATSAEDSDQMNAAWQAYVAAKESGDKQATIEAASIAADAGRETLDEESEELPLLLYHYGVALLDGRQNSEASFVLQESLQLSEQLHGKKAKELIAILEALGDSVAGPRSSSSQFRYYRRGLDLTEQYFGRESKEFADASLRAAARGYDRSGTTEGLSHLRDAREVYANLQGEDSSDVGVTDYMLAKFEFSKGRFKPAEKHALSALQKLDEDGAETGKLHLYTRALLIQAYEERGMSDKATPHCVAIGRINGSDPDRDYLPIFRMAPQYPVNQLRRRNQGTVELEFSIDEFGFVRNPQVVASTGKGFNSAAIDAVERFRYAPKFVDGIATPVDGVKTRISFQLEL